MIYIVYKHSRYSVPNRAIASSRTTRAFVYCITFNIHITTQIYNISIDASRTLRVDAPAHGRELCGPAAQRDERGVVQSRGDAEVQRDCARVADELQHRRHGVDQVVHGEEEEAHGGAEVRRNAQRVPQIRLHRVQRADQRLGHREARESLPQRRHQRRALGFGKSVRGLRQWRLFRRCGAIAAARPSFSSRGRARRQAGQQREPPTH